jgi:hypothetical protein
MPLKNAQAVELGDHTPNRRAWSARWTAIWGRMYADFWMPSRLGQYRRLLETALRQGYRICSLRQMVRELKAGLPAGARVLVLRHDVDTGVRTARRMWLIERELGVSSSYFFRLRTIAIPFMRSIEENGGEASYHFEELSTVAKRRGIRRREEVAAIVPEARQLFARNLARLRERTGLPMEVVAGHGDWINRRLGVQNSELLSSVSFRREVGVDLEAYDPFLIQAVLKHSDGPPSEPWLWEKRDPERSILSGIPAIQVLVHPRHWRVERGVNLMDNVARCAEELWYRVAH